MREITGLSDSGAKKLLGNLVDKKVLQAVGERKNRYYKFCSFGSKKLPCPREGEISYEAIKATEEDMEH